MNGVGVTRGRRVCKGRGRARDEGDLDTRRTLTVSIAGPGRITVGADGSITYVGTGPELFFFLFHGNPGITLLTGRSVDSFDAQGNETFSYVGTTRDLCAELAG